MPARTVSAFVAGCEGIGGVTLVMVSLGCILYLHEATIASVFDEQPMAVTSGLALIALKVCPVRSVRVATGARPVLAQPTWLAKMATALIPLRPRKTATQIIMPCANSRNGKFMARSCLAAFGRCLDGSAKTFVGGAGPSISRNSDSAAMTVGKK